MSQLVIFKNEQGRMEGFISKANAIELGLKHYLTGVACKHGHVAKRFVSTGGCVECNRLHSGKWESENSEIVSARKKISYQKNRIERIEKVAKYKELHPGKVRASKKSYYQRNKHLWAGLGLAKTPAEKIKMAIRVRAFRLANPEKNRAYKNNRRARLMSSFGKHTGADIQRILKAQRYLCIGCRKSIRKVYSVDHIFPLSLGGSNGPENIQMLCSSCNSKKGAKHPGKWANQLGLLL